MNASMVHRVQRILADILYVSRDEVTMDSSPSTIEGWDSIQHLNLVLAIEQEFGVQFLPDEIEELSSVRTLMELLEAKLDGAVR